MEKRATEHTGGNEKKGGKGATGGGGRRAGAEARAGARTDWGGASGGARRRPRPEGLVGSGCARPETGAARECVRVAGLWD